VIPRFLSQIRNGGPVTVTHPEIRRYFMLIPEAVQLVLHAAALGESGVTYVLDMGEQIRLLDMARNVIRLAGFVPDQEIPITFVGLRPGEKLFEELVGTGETVGDCPVPKIQQIQSNWAADFEEFWGDLSVLVRLAQKGDAFSVVQQLRKVVPTFQPDESNTVAALAVRREDAAVQAQLRPRSRPRLSISRSVSPAGYASRSHRGGTGTSVA